MASFTKMLYASTTGWFGLMSTLYDRIGAQDYVSVHIGTGNGSGSYSQSGFQVIHSVPYYPLITRAVAQWDFSGTAYGLTIDSISKGVHINSATLNLTMISSSLIKPTTIYVHRCLKQIGLVKTYGSYEGNSWQANADTSITPWSTGMTSGITSWTQEGMAPGADYDVKPLASFVIPSIGTYAGYKVSVDVTELLRQVYRERTDILGLVFVADETPVRRREYMTNKESLNFYPGAAPYWPVNAVWGQAHSGGPNQLGGLADIINIEVTYDGPLAVYQAAGDGGIPINAVPVAIDTKAAMIGYYLAGMTSVPQKFFIKNNIDAPLYNVRLMSDFAKVTVPVYIGNGTAVISPIMVTNALPGVGSPNTQAWRATCLTGGANSAWQMQVDQNSSTWVLANPSVINCNNGVGSYVSAVQGLRFNLTSTYPQITDKITFSTIANTVASNAMGDSEYYMQIAPDVDGAYGVWDTIVPEMAYVSVAGGYGVTAVDTLGITGFSVGENVMFQNMTLGSVQTYDSFIVGITGTQLTITGGIPWNLNKGDIMFTNPFSLGDFKPYVVGENSATITGGFYKAFWVRIVSPYGAVAGARTVRMNMWEGPLNIG